MPYIKAIAISAGSRNQNTKKVPPSTTKQSPRPIPATIRKVRIIAPSIREMRFDEYIKITPGIESSSVRPCDSSPGRKKRFEQQGNRKVVKAKPKDIPPPFQNFFGSCNKMPLDVF